MDRTTETAARPAAVTQGRRYLKRSPLSRLSFGHVVMISAGLLAFLLNVLIIRGKGETVEVLVAAHTISAGSRLTDQDLAYELVDAGGPFVDRVLSRQTVLPLMGHVVVRDVDSGAPLMAHDLRPSAAPGDARAMSIPIVSDQVAVTALQVGDRIDVITVDEGRSRFIAVGLEVLAVSSSGNRTTGDQLSVTVAVGRSQALALAEALDRGSIHLVSSTGADIPVASIPNEQGTRHPESRSLEYPRGWGGRYRAVNELDPVIAIAGSQRAWASELLRFLSDFGGARLKGTVLAGREALEPGYEVLIIDDITSYLSPLLVERLRESGRKVVGIYDQEYSERGREHLRAMGVDAVIPADAGPEAILEAVSILGPGRTSPDRERAAGSKTEPVDRAAHITVVAGGDLAGEFAVGLGGTFRARRLSTLVMDADTVTPMLAQRLSMPIVPNLLTALDSHVQLRGSVRDSLLSGPYGVVMLSGLPEASEWETVRADEVVDLIETTAGWFEHMIVKISPQMEDLSRFRARDGRFEVSRSVVGMAGDVIYVADPTPVGLSRALRWISEARRLTTAQLHIVFGGASLSAFQRGELSDELTRSYLPASITWLPSDQGQERSVWNGTAIPRGPFRKTIDRLGVSILNGRGKNHS